MKYIISFLILCSTVLAQNSVPYKLQLTQKEITYIKNSSKKNFIIKRFKQYKQLTQKIKYYPTFKKLSHVNAFFNKILPEQDVAKYGINDYWMTQKEFLIKGKGDCEDYAIAKYFTLLEVGIPKDKLFLAIVKVKNKQTNHMVLLYVKDKSSIPLVLDNLSFKVVPLNKRKKLLQKVAFNELHTYILYKNLLRSNAKIDWKGENKWEKILHRVYTLKE